MVASVKNFELLCFGEKHVAGDNSGFSVDDVKQKSLQRMRDIVFYAREGKQFTSAMGAFFSCSSRTLRTGTVVRLSTTKRVLHYVVNKPCCCGTGNYSFVWTTVILVSMMLFVSMVFFCRLAMSKGKI